MLHGRKKRKRAKAHKEAAAVGRKGKAGGGKRMVGRQGGSGKVGEKAGGGGGEVVCVGCARARAGVGEW